MNGSTPLAHEDLLTLARKLEAAVADGERERVEASAQRLLQGLVDHLSGEQADLVRLPPGEGAALAHRQQRLVEMVVEVAACAHARSHCRCDRLAQQLIVELSRQAEDERRGLADLTAPS